MPKILANSLDKFNKSCSSHHHESNKIGFAFFRFFHDFLEISQESAKAATLFKKQLTSRSLELLIPHKSAPGSHKEPRNFSQACNAALGAWPVAAPAKFRPAGGHGRPGMGGGRPGGLLGPILGVGWGRGTSEGYGQRNGAVTAAGGSAPAKLFRRRGNIWVKRLGWRSTVAAARSNWLVAAREYKINKPS
jgi:hypothetical protein